jgi:Holliday junction resolvase
MATKLESDIQAKIIRNLTKKGWYVAKIIQTTKNGWPDLLCLKDGKSVYIEVKRPGGKPSPLQLLRHREIAATGHIVHVTDDENFTL